MSKKRKLSTISSNKTTMDLPAVHPSQRRAKQCSHCNETFPMQSYSKSQWTKSSHIIRCKTCVVDASVLKKCCSLCKVMLTQKSFTSSRWKAPDAVICCKKCVKKREADAKDGNTKKSKKQKTAEKLNVNTMLQNMATRPPNKAGPTTFQFDWESNPIAVSEEDFVAERAVCKGSFGPMTETEKIQLTQAIENTSMTWAQATSLRSILLQEKAMFNNCRITTQAKKLHEMYRAGSTILELSNLIDCPPMNILRAILAQMKFTKADIKKGLKNPKGCLKGREHQECYAAEAADFVSSVNQGLQRAHADAFEDVIADWLDQQGVSFKRQIQLVEEQQKTLGGIVLTPDFLLLDQLEINGERVAWIDCKAYYGANVGSNVRRMKQQMSRYIDVWGSGAVIYLQGFSEAVKMEDCIMLNAHGAVSEEILSQMEFQVLGTI